MIRRGLRQGESGQSIITIALMSMFLLAILAVVVEASFIYFQRRDLQNAADAAALAGAQSLTGLSASETPAKDAAKDYVAKNISGATVPDPVVSNGYTQIQVTVKKNSASIFSGWLSFGSPEVTGRATARIAAPLLPGPGVVPLAIDKSTYDKCIQNGKCTNVTLKETSGNNGDPPSAYGWMDYGGHGGGADDLCDGFVGGSPYAIKDPDVYKSGGNNKAHNCVPTRMAAAEHFGCLTLEQVLDNSGALRDRCNPLSGARKGADPDYPDVQPTAVIVIPVITSFEKHQGCDTDPKCVDIVGADPAPRTFAIFLVDVTTVRKVGSVGPTCSKSNQCWITGQFLRTYFAPVSTEFDLPTGTYDPNTSLLKIVQLVD